MSGFVEEFGHRQKSEVRYLRGLGEVCELASLGGCRISNDILCMDHCHSHGFVRGWLCSRHNRILSWYDHGRYLVYGFPPHRSTEDLVLVFKYLNNCRGCNALSLQQRLDLRREMLRCAPISRTAASQLILPILRNYIDVTSQVKRVSESVVSAIDLSADCAVIAGQDSYPGRIGGGSYATGTLRSDILICFPYYSREVSPDVDDVQGASS